MGPVDHAANVMENLKVDEEPPVDYTEPSPSQDGNISDSSGEVSICSGDMITGNGHEVTPESGVFYSTNGYAPGYAYDYVEEYHVDPNVYAEVYQHGYGYAYVPYPPPGTYAISADQVYGHPYQLGGHVYGQYQVVEAEYDDGVAQRPVYPVAVVAPQSAYYHPRGVMAVHSPSSEGLRANAPPWIDMKSNNQRRPTVQSNKPQVHSQTSQSLKVPTSTTPALPGALGTAFPPLTRATPSTGKGGRAANGNDTGNADASKVKGKEAGADTNGRIEAAEQQNRGPRTKVRFQRITPGIFSMEPAEGVTARDQYNKADFPTSYEDARFFIIKSYSEDDVHKSIKYSVWASTINGNKKLDAAYKDAKAGKKGCPIFLFFSVNGSGQFCGVAEMTGPVDFVKTMDFWQQDKWSGCFSVKWHFIKDIPNHLFRHIILENNENKPVTNSRDTQEVKFFQGIEMLKIFKNFSCHKSILDDFQFYEGRQKTMQEKRAKRHNQVNVLDPVKCESENIPDVKETEEVVPIKNNDVVPPRKSYLSSLAGGNDGSKLVEVDVKAA